MPRKLYSHQTVSPEVYEQVFFYTRHGALTYKHIMAVLWGGREAGRGWSCNQRLGCFLYGRSNLTVLKKRKANTFIYFLSEFICCPIPSPNLSGQHSPTPAPAVLIQHPAHPSCRPLPSLKEATFSPQSYKASPPDILLPSSETGHAICIALRTTLAQIPRY